MIGARRADFGKSGMRELFYIWLIISNPDGGVTMQRLDQPYEGETQCVEAAFKKYREVRGKLPRARGALCYTPSEYNGERK